MKVEVHAVELKARPDLAVRVRVLHALEELELREEITKETETSRILAVQLKAYVCDEEGKPLLASVDDVLAWIKDNRLRASTCVKITRDAGRLNSLSDEALEEAEKN